MATKFVSLLARPGSRILECLDLQAPVAVVQAQPVRVQAALNRLLHKACGLSSAFWMAYIHSTTLPFGTTTRRPMTRAGSTWQFRSRLTTLVIMTILKHGIGQPFSMEFFPSRQDPVMVSRQRMSSAVTHLPPP